MIKVFKSAGSTVLLTALTISPSSVVASLFKLSPECSAVIGGCVVLAVWMFVDVWNELETRGKTS